MIVSNDNNMRELIILHDDNNDINHINYSNMTMIYTNFINVIFCHLSRRIILNSKTNAQIYNYFCMIDHFLEIYNIPNLVSVLHKIVTRTRSRGLNITSY